MTSADVLIVGGGIAGVSLAARLAGHARVLLLEREEHLAMHTTGRSAAMFIESYGNDAVRGWTRESRPFFERPPEGFTDRPLIVPRPSLTAAKPEERDALQAAVAANPGIVHEIAAGEAFARVGVLRREVFAHFAVEEGSQDIDVHALFEGFRRMALHGGVEIATGQEVLGIARAGASWRVTAPGGVFEAPVLVNAAGAWAGRLGVMAGLGDQGLVPMRRTAVTIEPPSGVDVSNWLSVNDLAETFYFKPDAGLILASPADETPSAPCDAQPEEIDVATVAWRIEEATTLEVARIRRRWAGLRTFTPARTPIFEFDPYTEGFFWLAGQGGYGIQTAPAISARAAALIRERL
ncbi:MAG TPA: FAD-binding oxidoreductase [Rhizomicrobium sp.]|nr:FAD-binding oxidoreductase [Rhizomicrobium sp.]